MKHCLFIHKINKKKFFYWTTGAGLLSHSRGEVDDEGDLVVDGDDSATFGPTQYTEADIIPVSSQGKNFQTLREALLR